MGANLCGGQHGVFVQAEDSVSHHGFIGQKAAAHHLWKEATSVRLPASNTRHLISDHLLIPAPSKEELVFIQN